MLFLFYRIYQKIINNIYNNNNNKLKKHIAIIFDDAACEQPKNYKSQHDTIELWNIEKIHTLKMLSKSEKKNTKPNKTTITKYEIKIKYEVFFMFSKNQKKKKIGMVNIEQH